MDVTFGQGSPVDFVRRNRRDDDEEMMMDGFAGDEEAARADDEEMQLVGFAASQSFPLVMDQPGHLETRVEVPEEQVDRPQMRLNMDPSIADVEVRHLPRETPLEDYEYVLDGPPRPRPGRLLLFFQEAPVLLWENFCELVLLILDVIRRIHDALQLLGHGLRRLYEGLKYLAVAAMWLYVLYLVIVFRAALYSSSSSSAVIGATSTVSPGVTTLSVITAVVDKNREPTSSSAIFSSKFTQPRGYSICGMNDEKELDMVLFDSSNALLLHETASRSDQQDNAHHIPSFIVHKKETESSSAQQATSCTAVALYGKWEPMLPSEFLYMKWSKDFMEAIFHGESTPLVLELWLHKHRIFIHTKSKYLSKSTDGDVVDDGTRFESTSFNDESSNESSLIKATSAPLPAASTAVANFFKWEPVLASHFLQIQMDKEYMKEIFLRSSVPLVLELWLHKFPSGSADDDAIDDAPRRPCPRNLVFVETMSSENVDEPLAIGSLKRVERQLEAMSASSPVASTAVAKYQQWEPVLSGTHGALIRLHHRPPSLPICRSDMFDSSDEYNFGRLQLEPAPLHRSGGGCLVDVDTDAVVDDISSCNVTVPCCSHDLARSGKLANPKQDFCLRIDNVSSCWPGPCGPSTTRASAQQEIMQVSVLFEPVPTDETVGFTAAPGYDCTKMTMAALLVLIGLFVHCHRVHGAYRARRAAVSIQAAYRGWKDRVLYRPLRADIRASLAHRAFQAAFQIFQAGRAAGAAVVPLQDTTATTASSNSHEDDGARGRASSQLPRQPMSIVSLNHVDETLVETLNSSTTNTTITATNTTSDVNSDKMKENISESCGSRAGSRVMAGLKQPRGTSAPPTAPSPPIAGDTTPRRRCEDGSPPSPHPLSDDGTLSSSVAPLPTSSTAPIEEDPVEEFNKTAATAVATATTMSGEKEQEYSLATHKTPNDIVVDVAAGGTKRNDAIGLEVSMTTAAPINNRSHQEDNGTDGRASRPLSDLLLNHVVEALVETLNSSTADATITATTTTSGDNMKENISELGRSRNGSSGMGTKEEMASHKQPLATSAPPTAPSPPVADGNTVDLVGTTPSQCEEAKQEAPNAPRTLAVSINHRRDDAADSRSSMIANNVDVGSIASVASTTTERQSRESTPFANISPGPPTAGKSPAQLHQKGGNGWSDSSDESIDEQTITTTSHQTPAASSNDSRPSSSDMDPMAEIEALEQSVRQMFDDAILDQQQGYQRDGTEQQADTTTNDAMGMEELEPAFLEESMYPSIWPQFHPVLGLTFKTRADGSGDGDVMSDLLTASRIRANDQSLDDGATVHGDDDALLSPAASSPPSVDDKSFLDERVDAMGTTVLQPDCNREGKEVATMDETDTLAKTSKVDERSQDTKPSTLGQYKDKYSLFPSNTSETGTGTEEGLFAHGAEEGNNGLPQLRAPNAPSTDNGDDDVYASYEGGSGLFAESNRVDENASPVQPTETPPGSFGEEVNQTLAGGSDLNSNRLDHSPGDDDNDGDAEQGEGGAAPPIPADGPPAPREIAAPPAAEVADHADALNRGHGDDNDDGHSPAAPPQAPAPVNRLPRATVRNMHLSSAENPGYLMQFKAELPLANKIHNIAKAMFNERNNLKQSTHPRTSELVPPLYATQLVPLVRGILDSLLPAAWADATINDFVLLVAPPNRWAKGTIHRNEYSGHENDPDYSLPVLSCYLALGKVFLHGQVGDDEDINEAEVDEGDAGSIRVWERSHKVPIKADKRGRCLDETGYRDWTEPFGTLLCTDARLVRRFLPNKTDDRRIFLHFFVQPRNGTRTIEDPCLGTHARIIQRDE